MNGKLLSVLSVCLVVSSVAIAPTVRAEKYEHPYRPGQQIIAASSSTDTSGYSLTPFHLVYLGYQGALETQGIPSAGSFLFKAKTGEITSRSLVQAAIDTGRLPSEILNDANYLGAVQNQIKQVNSR